MDIMWSRNDVLILGAKLNCFVRDLVFENVKLSRGQSEDKAMFKYTVRDDSFFEKEA